MKGVTPSIVIIGAGLTGLLMAYKLKDIGIKVKILEARKRIGGRIFTLHPHDGLPIEMGATWFGKKHINLIRLLEELGLSYFEQYIKGTAFFEPFSTAPAQAIEIPQQDPSFRIAGGTDQIINKLASRLNDDELLLNQPVVEIDFQEPEVRIKTADLTIDTGYVISTVPPALLVDTVRFEPKLPDHLIEIARYTQTWMQDAIKTGIIYQEPFWRNHHWSGTIFSNVGPLNEFYDHTDYENSKFALCGFVNDSFAYLSAAQRKEMVNNQLDRIFGKVATKQLHYEELIWADERYTKSTSSVNLYPHQNNGHEIYENSWYDDRMLIAGSETSKQFAGYMDGAVYSAISCIEKVLKLLGTNFTN